jgi:hypothetical protein
VGLMIDLNAVEKRTFLPLAGSKLGFLDRSARSRSPVIAHSGIIFS